jgi:hypothetical protein
MGLFDSLLKNVDTNKLKESLGSLGEELKKAAEAVNDAIPDDVKAKMKAEAEEKKQKEEAKAAAVETLQTKTDVSYATASYAGIDKDDYDVELPEDELDAKMKIGEVIATDWPKYDLYEDVSPTKIGGTGRFMNYSIGVYDGDKPVLFIMIIGKATTRLRLYRWSKEQAAKAGVPMINFIGHAPNRYWYIKERLAKYL